MKRFSLAGGMAAIGLFAVGSAALTHPSELWASTIFTLAVVLFCWAGVAAMIRRRPFWAGFAVFGGVYLILSLGMFGAKGMVMTPFPPPPPLITTRLMDYVEGKVMHDVAFVNGN